MSVGLRVGAPVAAVGVCLCGAPLDPHGQHALTCRRSVGRHGRHAEVNSRLKNALSEAGVVAILEPAGLTRVDGKRPDGVTVLPFSKGIPMAWDATIVHTSASSYLHATASSTGAAAASAEERKRAKYASLNDRVNFQPFGLETLGPFGPSARLLLSEIAARISVRTGEKGALSRLHRQIAAAVQIGNAACVLEAHGGARLEGNRHCVSEANSRATLSEQPHTK